MGVGKHFFLLEPVGQFGLQCLFHKISSKKSSLNLSMISTYWPMDSYYIVDLMNQFLYIILCLFPSFCGIHIFHYVLTLQYLL